MDHVQGVPNFLVNAMKDVCVKRDISHPGLIQSCKCRISPFNAVNIAVERPEYVASDAQPVNVMASPIGLNHQPVELRGNIAGHKEISGQSQAAK